ncbi:hypothetical protein DL766_001164 [Monosporascus sp. MC13-8B]|uniref:Uncharacterized protein n=1 Tax=Monosporascus cannonballus TaxID=155416 RepID=A0ABY0HGU4_9PEZI|nr:hypothetical protein DL762_002703 [Monosporascus cannonballus]RYO97665.1 hypothetical protein DL763_002642 [Monosporascus cannonballus]RYP38085.1 hypothetical protein DL766_001164 [Monosporascus sp. MC13-8B]
MWAVPQLVRAEAPGSREHTGDVSFPVHHARNGFIYVMVEITARLRILPDPLLAAAIVAPTYPADLSAAQVLVGDAWPGCLWDLQDLVFSAPGEHRSRPPSPTNHLYGILTEINNGSKREAYAFQASWLGEDLDTNDPFTADDAHCVSSGGFRLRHPAPMRQSLQVRRKLVAESALQA